MRVLLDSRKLGDGGIGVYLENLVDGLLQLSASGDLHDSESEFELSLLVTPEHLSGRFDPGGEVSSSFSRWRGRVRLVEEEARKYSFGEYVTFPWRQQKLLRQHDVFHAPHYTLPFWLGIPSVMTLHDVLHVSHPETWYHAPIARRLITSSLKRANGIIVVSERTERELRSRFGPVKTPLVVIPNAVRAPFTRRSERDVQAIRTRFQLSFPYLLFVGSDRPHKGFLELVEGLSLVRERVAALQDLGLCVVGTRFSDQTQLAVTEQLGGAVRFVGAVSTSVLATLYSGAAGTTIASREEGFGLMGIEALACGCSVVSTPLPAIRESCGEAAFYAAAFDAESIADALQVGLCNETRRLESREHGLRLSSQFTPTSVAGATYSFYQRIIREQATGLRDVSQNSLLSLGA